MFFSLSLFSVSLWNWVNQANAYIYVQTSSILELHKSSDFVEGLQTVPASQDKILHA